MPNYTFRNNETGDEFVLTLSMAEREEYLANNPTHEQILTPIPLADPTRLGLKQYKPSNEFRDRLKEIKKSHKGSTINTW